MNMDKFTTPSLGNLEPSATLAVTSKAKAMKAEGQDVLNLCAGEPDFDTPDHVKEAAIQALRDGDTKYTPASGKPELCECVAEKLKAENGISGDVSNIVISPGAKYSVFTAIATLSGPGDEVLLPRPYWLSYDAMIRASGATPVYINTRAEEDFCVTREDLDNAVTDKTKALILNTPSNPTGSVYPQSRLAEVADFAVANNVMVVADEIYEKLIYDADCSHTSIASLGPEIAAHTITINGFSKAFSMTGWRLGYLSAPDWVVKRIKALQSHTTSNPVSFAQAGALAATREKEKSDKAIAQMCKRFQERRELIYKLLSDIPGLQVHKPKGAFYIFPDISNFSEDAMTFAQKLLEQQKLALIPGTPFGAPSHIRLSYACDNETIEQGCSRLAEFCKSFS